MNFKHTAIILLLSSFSFSAMATQTGPSPFPPKGPLDECPSVNDPWCNDNVQQYKSTDFNLHFDLSLDGYSDETLAEVADLFGTEDANFKLVVGKDTDGNWVVCETSTGECVSLPTQAQRTNDSYVKDLLVEEIQATIETLSSILQFVFYPDGNGGMWSCDTLNGGCTHYPAEQL